MLKNRDRFKCFKGLSFAPLLVGGIICTFGQVLGDFYQMLGHVP